MPEPGKPARVPVKVGFTVSADEWDAMVFVKNIHGAKYEGVASVLNDYSVAQCVQLQKTARVETLAGSR